MFTSLIYFIFALIGLGFLIFIHELGHYYMARRTGMRVESFGIGFGKPIYTFLRKGVKWNICWLPFGGYVKIAGMEKEGNVDPQDIPDGFFGKSPWARIQVAIMGPLANIVLAFVFFLCIWMTGGRDKSFTEITKKIGWIDPQSELYAAGVRPGDEIVAYDGAAFRGSKDHFQAAMMAKETLAVNGRHFDYKTGSFVPFSHTIKPYAHPLSIEKGILTTGVLSSASYLIYDPAEMPLPTSSPFVGSALLPKDRIVWLDGEPIYSLQELSHLLNDTRALCTIQRGDALLLRRVPRIVSEELKFDPMQKEELMDWQWEAKLKSVKFQKLVFIPYNLNADGVVESRIPYLDERNEAHFFTGQLLSEKEEPLLPGDRIVAVDGFPVKAAYQILTHLQDRHVQLIVERHGSRAVAMWDRADETFDAEFPWKDIHALESGIGSAHMKKTSGNLILLAPTRPCTRAELFAAEGKEEQFAQELQEERLHIQAIDDPEKREQALQFLQKREQQLLLGIPGIQDIRVHYNPNPLTMFTDVVCEVANTLMALVGGYLHPKWLSGPIGIVQVIHVNWMVGAEEAFFWMATISLNLGLLNLLPLPVLDGGYICLSLFEMLTGRKLKAKTIEKIVIPFAVLLIGFFIFLTYNDVLRVITQLLR